MLANGVVETANLEKPATLKDVAREANVSAMAVSNVLNNRGRVSDETRRKIMQAVHKLNYIPNHVAQSLRNAKTQTIGVVMSDSSPSVFANLLMGVERVAAENQYSVLFANTARDREAELKAANFLVSKRIDGLLLAAPVATDAIDIDHLKTLGLPFVFLMRTTDYPGVCYAANDNVVGGYLSVKHLSEVCGNQIFFISLKRKSGAERECGYQKYLSEHGYCLEDYFLERVPPTIEDGYRVMKRIIAEGHRRGAVCCGCDVIAIGAMNAILEAGFAIPGDFCVMGYDDFELAPYLRVPLSTIRQPIYRIGTEGVRLLLERINDNTVPMQSIILQPELIIRDSTVLTRDEKESL